MARREIARKGYELEECYQVASIPSAVVNLRLTMVNSFHQQLMQLVVLPSEDIKHGIRKCSMKSGRNAAYKGDAGKHVLYAQSTEFHCSVQPG